MGEKRHEKGKEIYEKPKLRKEGHLNDITAFSSKTKG